MRSYKFMVVSALLCLFTVSSGYSLKYVPEQTASFLYVKDIKNLETNLKKSGLVSFKDEYFNYLLDYFSDEYQLLKLYKQFREMDDGAVLNALTGEMYLIQFMNDQLALVKLSKSSAFFVKASKAINSDTRVGGYYVDSLDDFLILSSSRATINYYKSSLSKSLHNPVLDEQLKKTKDIYFYKSGSNVFLPGLDRILSLEGNQKQLSLGLDFEDHSITLYTSPTPSYNKPGVRRQKNFGLYIPGDMILFTDSTENPARLIIRLLGNGALGEFDEDMVSYFDDQTAFAITELTKDIQPSFVMVLRARKTGDVNAGIFLSKYLTGLMEESGWNNISLGKVKAYQGKNSGVVYFEHNNYYVICSDKSTAEKSVLTVSGNRPSVWEGDETKKLAQLLDKNSAFAVYFNSLAQSMYSSMLNSMKPSPEDKEHLKYFMRTLKSLGIMVGYGEKSSQYNRYFMVMKKVADDKDD